MNKVTLGLVLVLVLALALVVGPGCAGEGAEFELSGLTITPSEVGVDEEVSIRVMVENVGEDEGTADVDLFVDGEKIERKEVHVAPGASRTVTFSHSEAEEGTYAIEVEMEETVLSGTLTVTAASP